MAERAERKGVFKQGLSKGNSFPLLSGLFIDKEFVCVCVCVNLRESNCRERARHSLRYIFFKTDNKCSKDDRSQPRL